MSQYSWEEKKEDSVNLLKATIEAKANEMAELNRRLKKKIFDLHTISELSRKLNSILDLDSLLENTLSTCLNQLAVRSGAIEVQGSLKDKSFFLLKTRGEKAKPVNGSLGKSWKLALDSPLAAFLKDKNRPLFLEEIAPEFKTGIKKLNPELGFKAEVVAPLVMKNNLRGVLFLSEKISGLPYSEEDLEILSILVNQISVAVENSLLYQSEKDINLELKQAQQQLVQAEKLAALGTLSAAIAHEVNNPLGIIKNYLTILSQTFNKADKSYGHLKVVKEEVDRIARIVKQLLEFYRPKSERMGLIDVGFLLEDTLNFVEEQFSQDKIYIKKNIPSNLVKIKAFPDEMRQVFLNLLMNSKECMPAGGEIEVCIKADKEKLGIEFKDTGCGISKEDLLKVFEPFYTTKDKGLGLGLWVCSEIIKRHKGEIRVENRKDKKGSCFKIGLPIEV